MYPTSTTPEEQKLPKPEDVTNTAMGERKTLDDQLVDQKKLDNYSRSKHLQDQLTSVISHIINPGVYIISACLLLFSIYLIYSGEYETIVNWLERGAAFIVGGFIVPIIIPYIKKQVS